MRITESQLRRIVREEAMRLNEFFTTPAAPAMDPGQFDKVMRVLLGLHRSPVKTEALLRRQKDDAVYHVSYLATLPLAKIKQHLQAMVVHDILSRRGPDLGFEAIIRQLNAIQKALGVMTIIEAYEMQPEALESAMRKANILGRGSDKFRHPVDRLY